MTLEEFVAVAGRRILTPPEFVAFAAAQQWRFDANGPTAALLVPNGQDPLARQFAKMLSREPYRTNVLKYLAELDAPRPAPPPEPETEPVVVQARVAVDVCPKCKRPTDEKRRCWHCCDRPCVGCDRATGSAFLSLCDSCGLLEGRQ